MAVTFPNPFSLFDLGMSKADIANLFSLLVDSFNIYVYPLDGMHSKQWLDGCATWIDTVALISLKLLRLV